MKHTRRSLLCLLLVLLLAAAALTGCTQNEKTTEAPKTPAQTQAQTEAPKTEAPAPDTTAAAQPAGARSRSWARAASSSTLT